MRLNNLTGSLINEPATVYGQSKYIGIHALAAVANSMAAAGASHPGVGVRIALPPYAYKSKIHTIEKNIKSACREQEIELLEIKSERNSAVNFPMVAVSGIAKVPKNDPWCKGPEMCFLIRWGSSGSGSGEGRDRPYQVGGYGWHAPDHNGEGTGIKRAVRAGIP